MVKELTIIKLQRTKETKTMIIAVIQIVRQKLLMKDRPLHTNHRTNLETSLRNLEDPKHSRTKEIELGRTGNRN